jgi:hypothetical protein
VIASLDADIAPMAHKETEMPIGDLAEAGPRLEETALHHPDEGQLRE